MFFRCPLIHGLLVFCCGILCSGPLRLKPASSSIFETFSTALLLPGLLCAVGAMRSRGRARTGLAALFLLFAGAGGFVLGAQAKLPAGSTGQETGEWHTGMVCRRETNRKDTVLLVDLLSDGRGRNRVRLSSPTEDAAPGAMTRSPMPGQRVRFFAALRRPAAFGNPGHFDYQRYLAARGVGLTARLKSSRLIQPLNDPPPDPAARIRRWVERTIAARYGVGAAGGLEPPGALLAACLVGERRWVAAGDEELLRRSGLAHLLAISGLHLGLLGLALTRVLSVARFPMGARRLLLILFFVAYHEMCNSAPSITRAMITAVVFLSGRALGRHTSPLNSLAAAGFCILWRSPLMLYDAGFLMTFGATSSILLLAPALAGRRHFRQGPWWAPARLARTLFAVSAAVLLGIAPLQACLFHRSSPAALLTNPAAGPLLGLSLTSGLVFLVSQDLCTRAPRCCALLLEGLACSAGFLMDCGFNGILWLAGKSAHLSVRLPTPSPAVVGLYYIFLAAALRLKKKSLFFTVAPCLFLVALVAGGRRLPANAVRVTFLDVGQGDAALIECPGGRRMVIDGGGALPGRFDFGEMAVSPSLWSYGLHTIDEAVVSHGHQDHAGGLSSIIRNFRPQRILAGRLLTRGFPAVRKLLAAAGECGAPLVPLHRGMVLRRGEVELLVLHPPPFGSPADGRSFSPNNNSLVLLLRHRQVRMLFSGDLEAAGEELLLTSPLSRLVGDCQLLKVGHHGAPGASSAEWLKLVSPQTAVITAGRFNRFGHPDPLLDGRLRAAGCRRIHCTGRDGALVVVSDGRRLLHRTGPF